MTERRDNWAGSDLDHGQVILRSISSAARSSAKPGSANGSSARNSCVGTVRGLAVRLTLGLAAAAGLIGLGSLLSKPTPTHAAEQRSEPIVEHVSDPSELDGFAAALFDGASGGLLSARQL